ncbi:MAG TPA: glutaredoxin family protein [Gaiellaceae bacterium]|nr:glutaredoxin family protein [Gaiellaceae bacterium]
MSHDDAAAKQQPPGISRERNVRVSGLPVCARVSLYHAPNCSLCARAIEVVEGVRAELGFELALVDISGVPELEERYRELLPAVEIDGELGFTYFVDAAALRERLQPRT